MTSFIKLCIAAILFALASPAFAQATRTWVSGVGDDVNPCSRTAPCKTFAGAISKTANNGEINVLDSGGFGAVTITKSITIDGAGPHASILAAGQNGIIINGPGITVNLRNLSINGVNSTFGNGIRILQAAAVNIDNVNIMNFGGTGRTAAGSRSKPRPRPSGSTFPSSIYNTENHGIHSAPPGGNVILVVDNVRVARGALAGINLQQSTAASIHRSAITNNRNAAGVRLDQSSATATVRFSFTGVRSPGILLQGCKTAAAP